MSERTVERMGEMAIAIGYRIAVARERSGLSQSRLGTSIGLGRSTVCHYEAGRRVPSLGALYAIARALGISAGSLLP